MDVAAPTTSVNFGKCADVADIQATSVDFGKCTDVAAFGNVCVF